MLTQIPSKVSASSYEDPEFESRVLIFREPKL